MIKIVFTIGTLLIGGAEKFLVNLISKLNKRKYEIYVIVLDKKNNTFLETELEEKGINIYYLNKKEGFSLKTFIKVYKILKKIKPHIIHGNIGGMIYSLPYVFFNNHIRVIHTTHTLASIEYGRIKRLILRYFYKKKKILPVVISNINKDEFIKIYKISPSLVYLIPNGVDLSECNKNHQFSNTTIRLGHIGRFEEVKNHQVIFQVYNELKRKRYNVSLILIGDGSLFNHYREKYQEVSFIRSTDDVNRYLENIDFFLFPSKYEGLPLAVIEAMASGCIVIASDVGGLDELITNDINGFKLNFDDVAGFIEKIEYLFRNRKKLNDISHNNKIKAYNYSLDKMVKMYEELYKW